MANDRSQRSARVRPESTLRRAGAAAVALLLTGMTLLFFWPRGEDVRLLMLDAWSLARSWGLPDCVSPEVFAAIANGLVFVPLTFALTVLFRRVPWWVWALSGFAMGLGIESVQMFLLGDRVPEVADTVANGLGGMAGAGVGAWVVRRARRSRTGRTEECPRPFAGPRPR